MNLIELSDLLRHKSIREGRVLMITSLWILVFKMRLSGSCVRLVLLMLVFITVVSSAVMKGQNKDFLNFLNEAFDRNSPEPAVVSVSDPSNAVGLPDPIAVCSMSTPMDNPSELFSLTPETDSLEYPDTADEKSQENSKSDDRTEDYDQRSSKKRNKLPETSGLDHDSADSKSAERTYMDKYVKIEKQPSKTQVPLTENRSSQEMYGPWDSVRDQEWKRRMDLERGHRVTQITEAIKMNSYVPDQSQAKGSNRKEKTKMRENSDSTPLNDSQNIIDQSQECVDMSSWMMGYPDEENTSVRGAGVDPQSEEGITNYERQPKKLCASRKRLSTPKTQSEQLYTDSAERVNSELLGRDNSNERIPAQTL
ncbi:uncharacterized protein LOC108267750 isoform X4 [Ictalurus punctatus]|uniref:Uncharacterized protein LOC108267750 isoform X4 n=1 Tax=Ictalurus punctatus TaxID=7998 RepID=A0A9F7THT7_ICTPU|nr:uncharacterized protein LOC108267750 isoform X4 [Ictalurus punctatus]